MNRTTPRPSSIVYLPVEFRSREFDSKALLAATLASKGYTVVIGQKWMIDYNIRQLPRGLVLFKGFNRIHHPQIRDAREVGHHVAIQEEEMLAHTDRELIESYCSDEIFALTDLILTDGEFERDILQQLSRGKNRIEITGNGRIDLLKPAFRSCFQDEIHALQQQYGDFVLANTNFAITNSIWGDIEQVTEIQVKAGWLDLANPSRLSAWQGLIDTELANREAITAAIRELSKRRPRQRIVVRPHPGENPATWVTALSDLTNVSVIREGSHVPWTLACKALMHTSCTTGFEAYIARKPAFSLVTGEGWTSRSLLCNKTNPVFANPSDLVSALEAVIDEGPQPRSFQSIEGIDKYVWNVGERTGYRRIAEILASVISPPKPIALPALEYPGKSDVLKDKFTMSVAECQNVFDRLGKADPSLGNLNIVEIGESLFCITKAAAKSPTKAASQKMDINRLRPALETLFRSGRFQAVYDLFRDNFGDAHRHPDLCFFVGISLFELGRYPLALQYFQNASMTDNVRNDVAFMLATIHQRLGQAELAHDYASIAYRQVPVAPNYFDLLKETARTAGRQVPEHWIVIGCSHVRYFRYMQVNQAKFFDGAVHLECHEYGGATAFGLGNTTSQSGALKGTQQIRQRLANADKVLVYFGEIDCRRAAWKAAAISGRTIEETIDESVQHLEAYVSRDILPHTRKVVLLGAKPQIIQDDDFYRGSLEDERIVFKPLQERERITLRFNAGVKAVSERLGLVYADIDHVLADDASREEFFKNAFWDAYTDDTHGNMDYFATLYYDRLKGLTGQG